MLYFQFNTDNVVALKKNRVGDNQSISEFYIEGSVFALGDIKEYFFQKLHRELGLDGIGMNPAFYEALDIPLSSFSVNDESVGNCDGVLKYVFSEYAKLPIEELKNKSLQDLGISIEFCKRIGNDENNACIKHYMQQNNLSYIIEDVLWKEMTDEQKVVKFSMYFEKISSEDKELIIIDPYFFKDDSDEYCNILTSVIKNSKAQSVIIVTEQKNYKQLSYDKIFGNFNVPVTVEYNRDFHDRFWIADRKKGFYTGTSFNGIGKRISLINLLSTNDVTEIIEELRQRSIIE